MTDDNKRRLRLLPEVLPDPTRGVATGSVRQRTIRHMNRLLALAATSASLGACSNGPVTGANAPPTDRGPDRKPVGHGLEIAVGLASDAPGRQDGYAVVDPIPPPATLRRPQIAQTIHARATRTSPSTFQLRLSEPGGSAGAAYSASSDRLVIGGTVVSSRVRASSARFDVRFEPHSESVTLYIPVQCVRCNPQQVRAVIQRADDGGLQVTLSDVW